MNVTVVKAEPTVEPVEDSVIHVTAPMPELLDVGQFDMDQVRAFYADQAETVLNALNASLPGGTLDALFALMAADKASLYRVRHRQPTA